MAWFQNLAERAEDLLNKIDQNAANVLLDNSSKEKHSDISTYLQPARITTTPGASRYSSKFRSKSDNMISEGYALKESSMIILQDSTDNKEDNGITFDTPQTANSVPTMNDPTEVSEDVPNYTRDGLVTAEEVQTYLDKISMLETESQKLHKQLLNLQHSYLELRNENSLLQFEAKESQTVVANLKQEMEMYRARAHKMLNEMKNVNVKPENSGNDDVYVLQIKRLNEEIEFQQRKNEELAETLKERTRERTYLQKQFNHMQDSWQQHKQVLENNLAKEENLRVITDEECKLKTQKLQNAVQELLQAKNLIDHREKEILHLKKSMENFSESRNNEDLESRIQSLTQTLMMKQHAMETVTTERNALRLQLEKVERKHQNRLLEIQRCNTQVVNVRDNDNDNDNGNGSQVPQFMRLSPMDAGVTRRVKRAYSTLDAISIRTGAFLRRYPVARVFVFCYMVILQIWVLFILLIYAPATP